MTMIELKAKLWRGVGLTALAAGVVACTPASAPHAATSATTPAPAAVGEGASEGGESGAEAVYAGLDPAARKQLRLQQLKGFLLIAQKALDASDAQAAGVLIGQGRLEVYTLAPADFAGLDAAALDGASTALMDGKPNGAAALRSALSALAARQGGADADLVRRMLTIAGAIYGGVNGAHGVDPVEYQHSQGAALAALDAFARAEPALRAKNAARAAEAKTELTRLVSLWPSVQAPDKPAPAAQVNAQISRVELALSGL